MKAIILAAGRGNRLVPITNTIPKTLIPINERPVIEHIFESLPDNINEVIVIVDYLAKKIIDQFGHNFKNIKINYAKQGNIRGTYGALLSAKKYLSGERFLVLNGDDLHDKSELSNYLSNQRSFGIQRMNMPEHYMVETNQNNQFIGLREQNEKEKVDGALVATGAYLLDNQIFNYPGIKLKNGEYGLPHTLASIKDEYPLTIVTTKKWFPINTFEDLEKIKKNNGERG